MADDELRGQSTGDAQTLQTRILGAVNLENDAIHQRVVARALGNALVVVVQEYLEGNSSPEDVELFFEVHGHEPTDVDVWPAEILADLGRQIPADARRDIRDRALEAALQYVRSSSPLAWG
ncbi:hypothetical protein [Phytohabitans rumicis]|uniref:Uncharacterized protein n=1 Tax=Phytohabitans rumicis TaxID=1076125 RepID=A0A6V8L3N8_9ACTN|nr:hypothetical protein [Phytohabitans rumicis]GFJ89411.1 hypothetical protein Prum_030530 [Phytohabitans rumicis]